LSYEVRLRRVVQKGLDALPERDYEIVAKAISTLEENPRPPRVKKLADSGLWRIRLGQYRIVYAIDDETKVVTLVRVARRREDTYTGLLR
jgi:mRNA interferase RelE/StbE